MTLELPLSPEDVNEIIAILDRSPYQRIDIRTARFSLQVVRSGAGWTQSWDYLSTSSPTPTVQGEAPALTPRVAQKTGDEEGQGIISIRTQLPGTFYRAPQPGAPPFIDVGSRVDPDTVIGIIETMKLMTPVHAGISGTVSEIRAGDAELVEIDAVLVRVTTAST